MSTETTGEPVSYDAPWKNDPQWDHHPECDKTTAPARDIIALALARARTSPPEYATATAYDKQMADRMMKVLAAAGWRISHE